MATPNEFDFSPEDAGGLVAPGSQKQAPVRFGSSPMPQGFEAIMSLAALGVSGAQWRNTAQFALAMLLGSLSDSETKVNSPVQLLAATVDTLAEANEDQFLASLTDVDRQQLITTLDKLIDVVGEDENHFLAPLRDLIANLIEKSEEYHDMKKLVPGRGLRAAYTADEPEYTPAQLNLIKSQRQNLNEAIRLKSDNAFAYKNRGIAYTGLGQIQDAETDYQTALELLEQVRNAPLKTEIEELLQELENTQK